MGSKNSKKSLRTTCTHIMNSFFFKAFLMIIIILNSIVIGIQTYDLDPEVAYALKLFDNFCVLIYLLEAILKLYVLRMDYFKDGWNVFDFVILIMALVPAGLLPVPPTVARVLRVFRAFRAFRLITIFKRVRIIVEALLKAIPSVIWTTVLLQIIFYVYAVCGVMLFGDTFPQYFGDLSTAFFMMFQFVTLDSWGSIAREIMQVQPMAWIYFFSFIIIAAFIVMNVFIGIIVGTMDRSREQVEQERAKSEQNRIEISAWRKVIKTKDKEERKLLRKEIWRAIREERQELKEGERFEAEMRALREQEAHARMADLVDDILEGEEIELPDAIAIHNEFTERFEKSEEDQETQELISRIVQETLDEHGERAAQARAERPQKEILSSEEIEKLMSRAVQDAFDERGAQEALARAKRPQKEILSSEEIGELMSRAVQDAFDEHGERIGLAQAAQSQKKTLSSEDAEELSNEISDLRELLDLVVSLLEKQNQQVSK